MHIAEVGYCSDLRHAEKQAEKRAQHAQLVSALEAEGWRVKLAPPITLGVGGTVCADMGKTLLGLGVGADHARVCAAKLHTHAVHTAGDIIRVRRNMERHLPTAAAVDRPP